MAQNGDPPPISPEMRAFAQELARMVQEATCAEHRRSLAAFRDHLDNRLDDMADKIERKLEAIKRELHEEIKEVRAEQDKQAVTLGEHGRQLTGMSVRLANGDKRFSELDTRLQKVEGSDTKSKITMAQIGVKLGVLAGQAGLAGAVAAYILAKLHP